MIKNNLFHGLFFVVAYGLQFKGKILSSYRFQVELLMGNIKDNFRAICLLIAPSTHMVFEPW